MKRVVHITAHLGGGVGKILSGIPRGYQGKNKCEHIIITLERTETPHFQQQCEQNNVKVILAAQCDIISILEQADIVQINWWHHPLMAQFIVNYLPIVKCRLVIWSHISGCTYPYINTNFIFLPEAFVFTTSYSYQNPFWTEEEKQRIMLSSHIVTSSALEIDKPIVKSEHLGFNVGYIGFLNYNKMHQDFVKYCECACDIPNINFIVVGDTTYGEQLIQDVDKSLLMRDKVIFRGYSLDILKDLSEFDVFGYPLNPSHTGTAENALLEAMAAGVVPVVLNQGAERCIVKNMETGLVVNSISEYGDALRWLYEHPKEREVLANNASKFIIKEYHINTTIIKINKVYENIMKKDKVYHDTKTIFGKNPYEWFLACYKGNVENIQGNAFGQTKGSVKQYLKYFKDDEKLRRVVEKNESRIKAQL